MQALTRVVIIIVVNLADRVVRVRLLTLRGLRCRIIIVALQLLQQPVAALLTRLLLLLLLVLVSPASNTHQDESRQSVHMTPECYLLINVIAAGWMVSC
jgi:hypothetical protein